MLNPLDVLVCVFANVRAFGNEASDQFIRVLVTPAFPCTVWMRVVPCCPFPTEVELLKAELAAKNSQILAQQETISKLTTALENATAGLNAAQALHAATIQKQLTDGRQGFWSRVFGRKN